MATGLGEVSEPELGLGSLTWVWDSGEPRRLEREYSMSLILAKCSSVRQHERDIAVRVSMARL